MKGLPPDGIVKTISFAFLKTSSVCQIHQLYLMKCCCTSFLELVGCSRVGRIYLSFLLLSLMISEGCIYPSLLVSVWLSVHPTNESMHGISHEMCNKYNTSLAQKGIMCLFVYHILPNLHIILFLETGKFRTLFEHAWHHLILVHAISFLSICDPTFRRLFLMSHTNVS